MTEPFHLCNDRQQRRYTLETRTATATCGWLTFVQVKNRNREPVRLSIPTGPELQDVIEATPGAATTMTFLSSERGTPYGRDGFGYLFRASCR